MTWSTVQTCAMTWHVTSYCAAAAAGHYPRWQISSIIYTRWQPASVYSVQYDWRAHGRVCYSLPINQSVPSPDFIAGDRDAFCACAVQLLRQRLANNNAIQSSTTAYYISATSCRPINRPHLYTEFTKKTTRIHQLKWGHLTEVFKDNRCVLSSVLAKWSVLISINDLLRSQNNDYVLNWSFFLYIIL